MDTEATKPGPVIRSIGHKKTSVSLSADQLTRLRRLCVQADLSVSQAIRRAVNQFIEREEAGK